MSLEIKLLGVDANPTRLAVYANVPGDSTIYIFPVEAKYFIEGTDLPKTDYLEEKVPGNVPYRSALISQLEKVYIRRMDG